MDDINKKLNYLNRKLITIKYYYMVEKSKIDKQNLIARAVLKLHHKKHERRWKKKCFIHLRNYSEDDWIIEAVRYMDFKSRCFDYNTLYSALTTLTNEELTILMHLEEDEKEAYMQYEFLEQSYQNAVISQDFGWV